MVIDKGKLIALLVDKTGRTKEEVAKDLEKLVARIREAAKSDRQFHIDGFGTFSNVNGRLHFAPSSQLKTEINQKYAGMKPIELMEAFKQTGAGIPVEENGHERKDPEPSATNKETPEEHPSLAEEIESAEKELHQPEHQQKEEEPRVPPAPVENENTGAEDTGPPASPSKEPAKKQKTKTKARPTAKRMRGNKRNGKTGTILLIILFVMAVIAGGWLLFNSGILGTSGTGSADISPADTTNQSTVQPVPSASDTIGAAGAAADSAEQTSADSVSQNNAGSPSGTAVYGLKGSFNEEAPNAYTIVIHSFRLRSTVQEIADSLGQRGYRTVLFDGLVNGENRWRIGLGQFQTFENAQDATERLTSPYKENHFIQRIR